jgi:hypothetical protein
MKKPRKAVGISAPGMPPLGRQVGDVMMYLRRVQSVAVVSVAALKHQNCELDGDIAIVLQRNVVDAIQDQLERLESIDRSTQSQLRADRGKRGAQGNLRSSRGRAARKVTRVR